MMELWRRMNNMGNLVLAIFILICLVAIVVGVVSLIMVFKKDKNKGFYDVVNEEMNEEDK